MADDIMNGDSPPSGGITLVGLGAKDNKATLSPSNIADKVPHFTQTPKQGSKQSPNQGIMQTPNQKSILSPNETAMQTPNQGSIQTPNHGSKQTPINPKGKGALSLGSPESLAFGNLSIVDARSATPDYDTDGSATPFRGPSRNRAFTSSPNTTPFRDFGRRNSNARYRGGYNSRTGSGSFRNSRTWISPDQQAQQEFLIIRNSMRRLFKFAEVSKWKFPDYIAHREAMVAAQANNLAQRVKDKEESRSVHSPPIPMELQQNMRNWGVHGNFDEVGNYGRVLGGQTIWCTDWQNGKEEVAPWPTLAEMKWEGDDRAKTGVGRFLALPREEGPAALMWNQLPIIEQYSLDQTAMIPTLEDIYLPVDDQIEPDHEYLWSKELEQDIDSMLEV